MIAEEFNIAPSILATILTAKEKYKSHYFGGEERERKKAKTDNCQAEVTLEESPKEETGEQKETEPTEDHEEDEAMDERQTQGQHGGKEWEAGVEMNGERATGDDESREGGKTGEKRQHEDTEHLQDTGKGQRESEFAEMTEEEREETKASKPQELLSKEDLFRIFRLELSGVKTIDDITGIAVGYQAMIKSYPVTVRSNIENVTVDTDASFWLSDDAPPFLPVRIYGDGNCLPRCASLMAYGTRDHYDG